MSSWVECVPKRWPRGQYLPRGYFSPDCGLTHSVESTIGPCHWSCFTPIEFSVDTSTMKPQCCELQFPASEVSTTISRTSGEGVPGHAELEHCKLFGATPNTGMEV